MVPDGYDLVAPNLCVGAAPPPGAPLRRHGFHTLVLCARDYQPPDEAFPGVEVLRVALRDDGSQMTDAEAVNAVNTARLVLRRLGQRKRVLVTCQQGRNRSGLVAALALVLAGSTPYSAIRSIREGRGPTALSNPDFVNLIYDMGS